MTATQPNYLSISRRALDVEDYMDIARRHIGWILGPMFAGLVITVVIAFMLPNSYESKATMQITPAQISTSLVPSIVNQQLAERVAQMEGTIMSRTSLSNLIQSPNLDLYPQERKKTTIDDVIEEMKRNLRITISQGSGTDRRASSFDIAFLYPNRVKAQATVQQLITRFNEENESAQQRQQSTIKDMFGDEVTTARANMQKAGENLTKFRIANQGRLPDQQSVNVAALTSLQMQYQTATERLQQVGQARLQLDTQLTTLTQGYEVAKTLAQEQPGLNTPQSRANDSLQSLNKEIETRELQLQQYLLQFKENYPGVRDMRSSLEILKKHRDELLTKQQADMAAEESAIQAKNAQRKLPAQVLAQLQTYEDRIAQVKTALKNNDAEKGNRLKDQENFAKDIQVYRDRLSPSGIDAQLADLIREQNSATDIYQKALAKQQIAAQSGDLINRRAGELLQVLDAPSIPLNASKPNRPLIIGGGFGVSLIVGLAFAALQEMKDTSLKNLKDVRAYTNLPVLGSIPLLENTMLVKRKRRITYLGWAAALILGIIAVCSSIFYYFSVTVNT